MVIELYTADQLVPQGELFRAVQHGTIDAAQSDDEFDGGAGRRRGVRRLLPVRLALQPRRAGAVALVRAQGDLGGGLRRGRGVTWLGAGAWDPCNFATTKPIRSLADLQGLRVYTFPTGGRFMPRFGVVPVTLPYEDVEVAMQTGELDGVCWSGITEDYTVGWAERHQVLPDQHDLRRLGGLVLRQHREVERAARAPEDAVPAGDGQLALLPPALVLVGRGALPHHGRQARADHDPRRGMGDRSSRRRSSSGTRSPRRASAAPRSCRSSRTTPRPWRRPARPTATADGSAPERLRLAQAAPSGRRAAAGRRRRARSACRAPSRRRAAPPGRPRRGVRRRSGSPAPSPRRSGCRSCPAAPSAP